MSRHLMAKMRRTAGEEDIVFDADQPHDEWRPRHGREDFAEWHPPYGESHIKYHVYPIGGGNSQRYWRANDHGLYQGMRSVERPGGGAVLQIPSYAHEDDDPHRVPHPATGDYNFRTMDDAKAAAERYHAENYGRPPAHDYDINRIMRDEGFQ